MFTSFAQKRIRGWIWPRSPKKHTHIHTECSVARVISPKVVRESKNVIFINLYLDFIMKGWPSRKCCVTLSLLNEI